MKVLFICNEYPPSLHGGIGSFTRDIAEGLVKQDVEVTIWGLYDNIDADTYEEINGVQVYREKYKIKKGRIGFVAARYEIYKRLGTFLRKKSFDIIECQEWQGLLPFGLKHKGYVIRLHGAAIFFDYLLKRKGNRLMHLFEKMTMKSGKNLVAVSDYCGRVTLDFCGLTNKPYTVIYNSVNSGKLQSFVQSAFKKHKIVFANSVLPKKGVLELAEAFNIVAKHYPEAELNIIGKLNYSENGVNIKQLILDKVAPEYRQRVNIPGWLEKADDVYSHIAEAHVCCYPSHMEGFGIAPVEAMAMGKATIFMIDGPGPEVIEDNVSGLLADTTLPQSIAGKIISVFSDDELAHRLGEEAKKRVATLFDRDSVFIPQNISYYKKILNAES